MAHLRLVHHTSTREFFVLSFWKDRATSLVLLPYPGVTPGVSEEIIVLLSLIQRRAVDEQLSLNEQQTPTRDPSFFLLAVHVESDLLS